EGTQEVTLSGRWFHEFDVTHRVQGNSILASLSFPLWNGAPQGLRRGREIGVCAATSAFGRPLPRRARQHGLRRVGRAHGTRAAITNNEENKMRRVHMSLARILATSRGSSQGSLGMTAYGARPRCG